MIGFQSFKDYVLLKTHFNEDKFYFNRHYNYLKITQKSFLSRKDKKLFQLFENKNPNRDDRIEMIISAFMYDKESHLIDIINNLTEDFHQNRIKVISSLESRFNQDCSKINWWLIDNDKKFSDLVLTRGLNPCIIIDLYQDIGISLESLLILDKHVDFLSEWYPINPLWKERRLQYVKYRNLLFQMNKNFDLIQRHFNDLANN